MSYSLIQDRHGLIPVLALEVEWYLAPRSSTVDPESFVPDFLEALRQNALHEKLPLHSISPEKGMFQVEAALHPENDVRILIEKYKTLISLVNRSANKMNAEAIFSAKPKAGDYGSGIHIHVHLEDPDTGSVFFKTEEGLSDPLRHSIGGLLETMEALLPVFIPSEASWKRIAPGFHAPVNVSWGFNNRTTAIRLPDGVGEYLGAKEISQHAPGHFKRIEHRVAGSDADVEKVIGAILAGIDKGLSEKIEPPAPIFGNAEDAQYHLKPFKR